MFWSLVIDSDFVFPEFYVKSDVQNCTSNIYVKHVIILNLPLFKDGGQFLDILLTVLRRKSVVDSEELVHSVLSTLNNLSYYPTSNDGAFGERQLEIAQGKLHFMSWS